MLCLGQREDDGVTSCANDDESGRGQGLRATQQGREGHALPVDPADPPPLAASEVALPGHAGKAEQFLLRQGQGPSHPAVHDEPPGVGIKGWLVPVGKDRE